MSPTDLIVIQILGSVMTVMISVASSMFVAGTRWGRVESEVRLMSDRLAKIEGMFTLQLKKNEHSAD